MTFSNVEPHVANKEVKKLLETDVFLLTFLPLLLIFDSNTFFLKTNQPVMVIISIV